MNSFTKKHLKNIVPERIFWRGEDLYNENAIKRVNISGNLITAKILGSRMYTVKAEYLDNNFFFSCTCPYNDFCKHEVALGLWMIEHKKDVLKVAGERDKEASKKGTDIETLVNKATGKQKDKFLAETLKEFPILLNRFEIMLKGAENLGNEINIGSLVEEIRKKIESFDLTDYTRFYESEPENFGYREEWQILQDGAEAEFEGLIEQYTKKALDFLSGHNVLSSFKYVLAVYEALKSADFGEIKNPDGIFETDDFYYLADEILSKNLDEFRAGIIAFSFNENVYNKLIDILFERIRINSETQLYNLKDFNELLQCFIQSQDIASYLLEKFKMNSQLPEENYCEALLAVYEKLGNEKSWLEIAVKYYKTNRNIAKKLFKSYAKDKTKLMRFANESAFLFDNKFIPFFYKHLDKKDNPALYQKIFREHVRSSQSLELFEKYKGEYGAEAAEELINSLENKWESERFFVSLLTKEKYHERLLTLAKRKSALHPAMAYIRPIVNVYPDAVYNIISSCTQRFLEKNKGREYYRQAAEWLKLLKKIKDKNVRQKADSFLKRLMKKYYNRSAMKDEFRRAKLI